MDPKKSGMTFNEFSQNFIKDSGVSIVCKVCNVSLSKFTLKKHVRLFHATTKSFFCELCSEGFRKAEERTQHMAASHPGHFKCSSCKVQFYISSSFVEHMQIIHNESVSLQPLKKLNEIDVPIERLRFTKEITEDTSAEVRKCARLKIKHFLLIYYFLTEKCITGSDERPGKTLRI